MLEWVPAGEPASVISLPSLAATSAGWASSFELGGVVGCSRSVGLIGQPFEEQEGVFEGLSRSSEPDCRGMRPVMTTVPLRDTPLQI